MVQRYLLIRRKAYRRKGYRKDIKPNKGIRYGYVASARVSPATFRIRDRGARGRGPRVIPSLQRGELAKHGYGISKSATARRRALSGSVNEDGYRTTLSRLIALQVFFKRVQPRYSRIAARDRKWLVRKYGGGW